jgi:anti-anti-sigma factor
MSMPSPETPGFSIKIDAEQSVPRVIVTGELDLLTSPQLKEQLTALTEQEPTRVVLDLTGVSFFDSSALNVVLHAQREAGEQNFELAVVPSAAVSRVIDLTGVADHLTVVHEPPA